MKYYQYISHTLILLVFGIALNARTLDFSKAEGYLKYAGGVSGGLAVKDTYGKDAKRSEDSNLTTISGKAMDFYLNRLAGEQVDLNLNVSVKKVHDFVVAKDGSGDFTSINEAISAVPDDGNRYSIFIKKGNYEEKVFIGDRWQTSNKIISIIGENVDSVVIIWDDYHGKQIPYPGKTETITADGMTAPTMTVTSPDFYMENITVKNPSTAAQAEALYQAGDRQVLKNCKILGNQDTHRTKKGRRYFYFRSTIEGGVDFIYSGGTCYFYQCDIISNRSGYITAPEDITYSATLSSGEILRYGFFFKDCDILATDDVNEGSVYLGRPWGPECGSVFLNCRLGSHINQNGWQAWNGNETSASFGEYKSMNSEGTAEADVSGRVSWSRQFSTADINKYMLLSKIYSSVTSIKFDPIPEVIAPEAPTSLTVNENNLSWGAVEGAIGYVIYANGSVIGFNTKNQFSDSLNYDFDPEYTVKSVGAMGNLSEINGKSEDFTEAEMREAIDTPITISANNELTFKKKYIPRIENETVWFEKTVDCRIYTVLGQEIAHKKNITNFKLSLLQTGIYIFSVMSEDKTNYSFKVMYGKSGEGK